MEVINIKELKDIDKGRYVVYFTKHSKELGRIKSWNDKNIFVVYNCNNKWDQYLNYTACATDPIDLFILDNMSFYK